MPIKNILKIWMDMIMTLTSIIPSRIELFHKNRIIPQDNRLPEPCNYANVSGQLDCYYTENNAIKLFFKQVPAKLNKKDPSGKLARKFKQEQSIFMKRVKRYCDRQDSLYY